MDCVLLMVLMLPVVPVYTQENGTINESTSTAIPTISSEISTSGNSPTIKSHSVTLQPAVGRIQVKWLKDNPCQGNLLFSIYFTQIQFAKYLCKSDVIERSALGTELCEERRCGEFVDYKYTGHVKGYMIHENLTVTNNTNCTKAFLTCKDKEDKELVAYKVITGLLLTLIIGVLLSRFAQPTYIAVRKRFSQKRQNRWIGPTQSQSVSYHRGQAGNPNNDTMKRQSYPGLEKLMVYPSREPSSNRNSDYDSYGN